MKQTFALTLALLVGLSAWVSLAALEQAGEPQPQTAFLSSYFTFGPKHLTISTRAGQVLSVLEVPAGVAVSMHLIKGESSEPNDKTEAMTFTGDVSLRTRRRSELVQGLGSQVQMMNAPLRLDVQDAVVTLSPSR